MKKPDKLIDEITLRVIVQMIYLLGYYLLWMQATNGVNNGENALEEWNTYAEELGVRRRD